MRTNCFGYEQKNGMVRCKALREMLCRGNGECGFFKTKEQYKADLEKYPWDKNYMGGTKK